MPTATVTSKGQLTLPAEVRRTLRLVPGSRVDFEKQPDGTYSIRARTLDIRELRGIVKYEGPPVSIEDMKRAVADHAAERDRRSRER